ncbi:unnamed protein product [Ambrosiozyma monospora]|uniref:Unnamed protein product n=1 Tax=Ambrosiozyma monospora TaxID=43982 RepID=A0ACB5T4Z1_AMBMO|nr:unnamed protein product [Ambrosiozyma monospora]
METVMRLIKSLDQFKNNVLQRSASRDMAFKSGVNGYYGRNLGFYSDVNSGMPNNNNVNNNNANSYFQQQQQQQQHNPSVTSITSGGAIPVSTPYPMYPSSGSIVNVNPGTPVHGPHPHHPSIQFPLSPYPGPPGPQGSVHGPVGPGPGPQQQQSQAPPILANDVRFSVSSNRSRNMSVMDPLQTLPIPQQQPQPGQPPIPPQQQQPGQPSLQQLQPPPTSHHPSISQQQQQQQQQQLGPGMVSGPGSISGASPHGGPGSLPGSISGPSPHSHGPTSISGPTSGSISGPTSIPPPPQGGAPGAPVFRSTTPQLQEPGVGLGGRLSPLGMLQKGGGSNGKLMGSPIQQIAPPLQHQHQQLQQLQQPYQYHQQQQQQPTPSQQQQQGQQQQQQQPQQQLGPAHMVHSLSNQALNHMDEPSRTRSSSAASLNFITNPPVVESPHLSQGTSQPQIQSHSSQSHFQQQQQQQPQNTPQAQQQQPQQQQNDQQQPQPQQQQMPSIDDKLSPSASNTPYSLNNPPRSIPVEFDNGRPQTPPIVSAGSRIGTPNRTSQSQQQPQHTKSPPTSTSSTTTGGTAGAVSASSTAGNTNNLNPNMLQSYTPRGSIKSSTPTPHSISNTPNQQQQQPQPQPQPSSQPQSQSQQNTVYSLLNNTSTDQPTTSVSTPVPISGGATAGTGSVCSSPGGGGVGLKRELEFGGVSATSGDSKRVKM